MKDFKKHQHIQVLVGPFGGKIVTKVSCGDDFTIAATEGRNICTFLWCIHGNCVCLNDFVTRIAALLFNSGIDCPRPFGFVDL